jgi:hypothetical protein
MQVSMCVFDFIWKACTAYLASQLASQAAAGLPAAVGASTLSQAQCVPRNKACKAGTAQHAHRDARTQLLHRSELVKGVPLAHVDDQLCEGIGAEVVGANLQWAGGSM